MKHRDKVIEDMETRLRDTKDRARSSKTLNQGARREQSGWGRGHICLGNG